MNALIVTLELDERLQLRLNDLRTRYFPPDRNYLDAHVTLFHALPAARAQEIASCLTEVARERASFEVRVPGPFSLGRGVAFDVVAPEINEIRGEIRARFLADLSPQDQRPRIRPHATVQNKVDNATARATLERLVASWRSDARGMARGLGLWEYRGGPWSAVGVHAFSGSPRSGDRDHRNYD